MARRDTKGSWTRDDVKQLKKLFPDRPTADVAAEIGTADRSRQEEGIQNGTQEVQKVYAVPGTNVAGTFSPSAAPLGEPSSRGRMRSGAARPAMGDGALARVIGMPCGN